MMFSSGVWSEKGSRPRNEDRGCVDSRSLSYAVFDGMGGERFGDSCAAAAENGFLGEACRGSSALECLRAADLAICELKRIVGDKSSGAAGVCARLLADGTGAVAWMGDCSATVVRSTGEMLCLTDPHRDCHGRLTRVLGFGGVVSPSEVRFSLEEGDSLILWSDGAWEGADAEEVAESVSCANAPRAAELIAKAGARRGSDNSTAVVVMGGAGHAGV